LVNLRERVNRGDPDLDAILILRWILGKWEGETGWSWLRIGTDGRHLWMRWWTFVFHKEQRFSWLPAEPVSLSRRTVLHRLSNNNNNNNNNNNICRLWRNKDHQSKKKLWLTQKNQMNISHQQHQSIMQYEFSTVSNKMRYTTQVS